MKKISTREVARFVPNRGQAESSDHSQGADGGRAIARRGVPQGNQAWIEATVSRLRASKAATDATSATLGFEDGREWAKTEAEAIELRRIAQAGDPWHDWELEKGSSAYSAAEICFFLIDPDSDGDRDAAADFWETMTDSREVPEAAYVQGFASGALQLWNEVKDQI